MKDHLQLFPGGDSGYGNALYAVFVVVSILVSLRYWLRSSKGDERLVVIYFGALAGAFVGAKLAYMIAEGWLHTGEGAWRHWVVGKSITGALLGGFVMVELVKKLVRYSKPTGDRFALIIPVGVIVGRLGCMSHGCCGGVLLESGVSWPAVSVEIAFNVVIWGVCYSLYRRGILLNQLFHVYLISYGGFRFVHEFMRLNPRILLGLSGYQWISVCMIVVGIVAFSKRMRQSNASSF